MDSCTKVSWSEYDKELMPNTLSILTINARSLAARYRGLVAHLKVLKNNITFIVVTESWLKTNENDFNFEIDGYKSVSLYRGSIGGGIKIYYLSHISMNIMDNLLVNQPFCEALVIKASVPGFGKLVVGGIYRPPNSPDNSFLTTMENILSSNCNSRTILTGDFNYNILNPNQHVHDYTDLFISYGFSNEINLNTYVSPVIIKIHLALIMCGRISMLIKKTL